jgi:eukaryotic-like serine/threonine-protein kinase
MTDRTGQRFDRYYLLRLLGRGASGEVYLAEHMHQHTHVALKILTLEFDPETLKTFLDETRTLFLLKHPSIVSLLDFGIEHETPFLVMELAPYGTLYQHRLLGERVPLHLVVAYVQQMASALQYAHDQRLIHRDVKPQNMLIGSQGQLLLSDFGVAAIAHSEQSLMTQGMTGTVAYMAPEQLQGRPFLASDQYALGICAYEWLCGVRPFTGSTWEVMNRHISTMPAPLRSHVPEIPARVEEVVLRALAKDPQQRFASVADFADALWQASQPTISAPPFITPNANEKSASFPTLLTPNANEKSASFPTLLTPDANEKSASFPNIAASEVSQTPTFVLSEHKERQPHLSITKSWGQAPVTSIPVAPRPRGLSKKWRWLLLIGVSVLLLGNLLLAFVWINNNQRIASVSATAEAQARAAAPIYQDWTSKHGAMFGFDITRTHWNPLERAISASNVADLHLLWSYTTGNRAISSSTVANGMVYVGSNDGQLYAFDANCRENCQPLWSYPTMSFIISSPTVANGRIYFGADNGKLYAFDSNCRKACQPLWSYTTAGGIDSSPVVVDGKVYVGSWDNTFYAFDASCTKDCLPLWSYLTGGGVFSSPATVNGLVYVGSVDGKLYAFETSCAENCRPLWSYPTGGGVSSSPSIANGIVYVGSDDGRLYAFDASCRANCQPVWSYATGNRVRSSPAIANGRVYVGADKGRFYAFDASCRANCQPLWSYATGDDIFSSPMVANGVVYVGSNDHRLYAFDTDCREGCQPLWSYTTGDNVLSSPTVANGVVYISSSDHKVYAFGL